MNTEFFIAKRIGRIGRSGMSRPIVSIATIGITIGIAVMIVSLAVVTGFQQEVQRKMVGFGSHVQINNISLVNDRETSKVPIDQAFYPYLDTVAGVRHIQIYATKAGVIETKDNIQGVILKGVGADMDTSFFSKHLIEGRLLGTIANNTAKEILLSKYLVDRLKLKLDQDITVYLFRGRDDIRPRKFQVVGIYETGLEQFDKEFALTDIHHIRRINSWGLNAEIYVDTTCVDEGVAISGLAFGGDGLHELEWRGIDAQGKGPHSLCVDSNLTVELVVSDRSGTLSDTSRVRLESTTDGGCACGKDLSYEEQNPGDSYQGYVGGFEVFLEGDALELAMNGDSISRVQLSKLLREEEMPTDLYLTSIREQYPELFAWLELLDTNVVVIIILMIIVATINMTSALLIIILERTNMIGILKALGSTNASIGKVFLFHAGSMVLKGIVLGTLIGVGLCLIQAHFGVVTLPQENYYVSVVPIRLQWVDVLMLDLFTLLVCVLVLILPSLLVTRISPIRAIRFD